MKKMIWLDSYGWPVEHIEGRWFVNWLRDKIHGKIYISEDEFMKKEKVRNLNPLYNCGQSNSTK